MPFLVRFLPRQIPSIYDLWFDEVTVRYTVSEPQATRMTYVSKRLIRGDHGLKRRGIVYIASAFLMLMPQYLIVQNWGGPRRAPRQCWTIYQGANCAHQLFANIKIMENL